MTNHTVPSCRRSSVAPLLAAALLALAHSGGCGLGLVGDTPPTQDANPGPLGGDAAGHTVSTHPPLGDDDPTGDRDLLGDTDGVGGDTIGASAGDSPTQDGDAEPGDTDPPTNEEPPLDGFGVRQLYPSLAGGHTWTSAHWAAGEDYNLGRSVGGYYDVRDPQGLSGSRGEGTLRITGNGELVMSGSQPRLYVYGPSSAPWQNVEITVYYRRVSDAATPWGGLVIGARSGRDGHTSDGKCDAHTYYSRLRHDGATDFEKELMHSPSATRNRVAPTTVWPPTGQLPTNTWIGWKYIIYNDTHAPGTVRFESYRDLTGGAQGGTWVQLNQASDSGGWYTDTTCSQHNPSGGQSDLVVLDGGAILIRNTDVTEARYRWVSVREIQP